MTQLSIDPEKCNKDGVCVQECPARIIVMNEKDDTPAQAENFDELCLRCGHCVAVCPTKALNLDWLTSEECASLNKDRALNPEQAEQFLRARRSYRTYKKRPVEREKLEKLLEIAGYAPSAKNMQPWRWTVVDKPAEVRKCASMVIDWMRGIMEKNPAAAEQRSFTRVIESWDQGHERICRGAPCVIIAHGDKNWPFGPEDCALAMSYLDLYAPSLNLGACWAGYLYSAINAYRPLFEALKLPESHKAYAAIMVGYPKFKYHRLPVRNKPSVTWL